MYIKSTFLYKCSLSLSISLFNQIEMICKSIQIFILILFSANLSFMFNHFNCLILTLLLSLLILLFFFLFFNYIKINY